MQPMEGPSEQRIKQRAYEIWEEEGRPEGRAQDHWRRAEAELAGQGGARGGYSGPGDTSVGGYGYSGEAGEAQGRSAGTARPHDTAQRQAGALKGQPGQGRS